MNKIYRLFKRAMTPVSIMVIPHGNPKPLRLKIPAIGILLSLLLLAVGAVQICGVVINGLKYPFLVDQVEYYDKQFSQWNSTVTALREVETDFRQAFSLKSRDQILENIDTSYTGSIDIQTLMKELQRTVETVDEIKDYLRIQKDIYLATPKGFPVEGNVSSPFGMRENPFSGDKSFHSGVDISASPGTPVRATADGVVSHSGWTQHSGYLVVLEHGCGFSTIYAHNKKNTVKMGQTVKRGEVIAYVGSTGKSTGPHVHYEVWEKGKNVNPKKYLQGRS
ncbi:MAG: peptidoglycan DD-metalloendopeptidase family protein [Deltaproteobacteria bacterium]|nr:peptidoglycan DD-metalloendopeptidase family protein [Deltaproteobacteria bacterium]